MLEERPVEAEHRVAEGRGVEGASRCHGHSVVAGPDTPKDWGRTYDGSMRRVFAIATLLTTMLACTSSAGSPRARATPAVNATDVPGLPASTTALPDVTYAQFHDLLGHLQGVPVVVNVWGSWCGPCREEGPRLAAAARTYAHRVQFLGLDVKDTTEAAAKFIRQMRWPYPSLFDPSPNGDVTSSARA